MKRIEELVISQWPWKTEFCEFNDEESPFGIGTGDNVSSLDGQFCESDANLIAAAPDMYKTEYDLVDVIERLMNGWAGTCDTPTQDEVVAALEAAKNALAKAAGEETNHEAH